jgi:hypothetical protein
LVSDIPAGDGKLNNLFYSVLYRIAITLPVRKTPITNITYNFLMYCLIIKLKSKKNIHFS